MSVKEIERNAEIALQEEKYERALMLYKKLLIENEKNPLLNFLVGYCYQNTDFGLEQSIAYLKNAIELKGPKPSEEAPIEAYYYLARAYQYNYQYLEAIKILNELIVKGKKNELGHILQSISTVLNHAGNGLMLAQTSLNVHLNNFVEINSKYSDRNPLIDFQSNTIYFTSRRENPYLRKKLDDSQYDENIFISTFNENNWSLPVGISSNINGAAHESTCWLSDDGNKMIFTRLDKNGHTLCHVSKNANGDWNLPQEFDNQVNAGASSTFGSFSPDGRFLYFTSSRKGGFGGSDIYVSESLGNNKWGPAINLGPAINTDQNEESPIMHQSGILFFSSEGHLSTGGFDVFSTTKNEKGKWEAPVNLGFPINSTGNDFFFNPSPDGQSALLSSDRSGSKGKSDVYKLEYADSTMLTYGLVTGRVICPAGLDASAIVQILISDESGLKKRMVIKPSKTGYYQLFLPSGINYKVEYRFEDNPFFYARFNIDKAYSLSCFEQRILMDDLSVNPSNLVLNDISNPKIYHSKNISNHSFRDAFLALSDNYRIENQDDVNVSGIQDDESENYYTIKLIASKSKLSLNSFNDLENVKEILDKDGNYLYFFGEYNYEWQALVKLRMIKDSYPDASVLVLTK